MHGGLAEACDLAARAIRKIAGPDYGPKAARGWAYGEIEFEGARR